MSKTKEQQDLMNSFKEEFGRILDPVAYLQRYHPELCNTFLKLHEQTLHDRILSRKVKLLMHAAITAAQHDGEATAMHISGAIRAGASEEELRETAYAVIPVAGMPAFAQFLNAWKKVSNSKD